MQIERCSHFTGTMIASSDETRERKSYQNCSYGLLTNVPTLAQYSKKQFC